MKEDFMKTGVKSTNNVAVSGGSDKGISAVLVNMFQRHDAWFRPLWE